MTQLYYIILQYIIQSTGPGNNQPRSTLPGNIPDASDMEIVEWSAYDTVANMRIIYLRLAEYKEEAS